MNRLHLRPHSTALLLLCTALLAPRMLQGDSAETKATVVKKKQVAPRADAGTGPLVTSNPTPPPKYPNTDSLLSHQIYKDRLRRAGFALDEMQQKLEEFGSITMSSLILARPHPMFSFELHLSPQELYRDAKNESEGTAVSQIALSTTTGISGAAQVDLDQLALAKIQRRNFDDAILAQRKQEQLETKRDEEAITRAKDTYKLEVASAEKTRKDAEEVHDEALEASAAKYNTASKKAQQENGVTRRAATKSETEAQIAFDEALKAANAISDPGKKLKARQDAEVTRDDALASSDATKNTALAATSETLKAARKTQKDEEKLANDDLEKANIAAQTAKNAAADKRDAAIRTATATGDLPDFPGSKAIGTVPSAVAVTQAEVDSQVEELTKLRTATGLIPASAELKLPDRAAIQQAAGDSATQSLLNFLGNPGEAAAFSDKVVLLGVCTVGVNPGWRSKKDFAATLTTRSTFTYQSARPEVAYYVAHSDQFPPEVRAVANAQLTEAYKHPNYRTTPQGIPQSYVAKPDSLAPLVAGITPMSDSQTLDLKDDFRRQDAISVQLALALRKQGAEGQAKIFNQFVRQQQKQAATRSAGGVVNTFSALGGLFGFQVGPRLKALADPASRRGGSANVLDRQSFPALLYFGIDRVDMLPKVAIDGTSFELVEPVMSLTVTSRWQPLKRGFFAFENFYNPLNWHKPRFSEVDRMEMNIENKDAENGLNNLKRLPETKGDTSYNGTFKIYDERAIALAALVNGANATHRLPLELLVPEEQRVPKVVLPRVSAVVPDKIAVVMKSNSEVAEGFTAEVVLLGERLDAVQSVAVMVGQSSAKVVDFHLDHKGALRVRLAIGKKDGPVMLRLFLNPETTNLGTVGEPYSLLSPPIFLLPGTTDGSADVEKGYFPGGVGARSGNEKAGAVAQDEAGPNPDALISLFPDDLPVRKAIPVPRPGSPTPMPSRSTRASRLQAALQENIPNLEPLPQ